jgi:hypothetical protein
LRPKHKYKSETDLPDQSKTFSNLFEQKRIIHLFLLGEPVDQNLPISRSKSSGKLVDQIQIVKLVNRLIEISEPRSTSLPNNDRFSKIQHAYQTPKIINL